MQPQGEDLKERQRGQCGAAGCGVSLEWKHRTRTQETSGAGGGGYQLEAMGIDKMAQNRHVGGEERTWATWGTPARKVPASGKWKSTVLRLLNNSLSAFNRDPFKNRFLKIITINHKFILSVGNCIKTEDCYLDILPVSAMWCQ